MRNGAQPQSAILAARSARADRTRRFTERFHLPTILLTINVPGPDKNEPWVRVAMRWGEEAIRTKLAVHGCIVQAAEARRSAAGPEWRTAVAGRIIEGTNLKRLMIAVEETEPLGRLFDIDVFDGDGSAVGRSTLGLPPRRCLVCNRPAHECARSANHSPAELRARINALVRDADHEYSQGRSGKSRTQGGRAIDSNPLGAFVI